MYGLQYVHACRYVYIRIVMHITYNALIVLTSNFLTVVFLHFEVWLKDFKAFALRFGFSIPKLSRISF